MRPFRATVRIFCCLGFTLAALHITAARAAALELLCDSCCQEGRGAMFRTMWIASCSFIGDFYHLYSLLAGSRLHAKRAKGRGSDGIITKFSWGEEAARARVTSRGFPGPDRAR